MMSIAETADMDNKRKAAAEVPSDLSEVWLGSLDEKVEWSTSHWSTTTTTATPTIFNHLTAKCLRIVPARSRQQECNGRGSHHGKPTTLCDEITPRLRGIFGILH
jgi:hypothetical protein